MDFEMLHLNTKKKWLVADVYRFFHSINIFYNKLYVFNKSLGKHFTDISESLEKSFFQIPKGEELRVEKLVIGSPGEFTLKGSGEVLEQIREFIKDMAYRMKHEKKKNVLDIEEKELEIEGKEPDNLIKKNKAF